MNPKQFALAALLSLPSTILAVRMYLWLVGAMPYPYATDGQAACAMIFALCNYPAACVIASNWKFK